MANLTLAVDDDLLHRARVRAATDGTSVNAVVRELLTAYSASDRVDGARRRLVALSVSSAAGSGGRSLADGPSRRDAGGAS
jgi:plasmid stability protein